MVIGRSPEETYWEFFRADRSKDAKAWAAVMNYPHVRVAGPSRIEYFRTEEEFVASTDWSQREKTGWVRTEGIEPQVIQSARDKVHLAGGWIRYNAENEPILSNRVVYVLTRVQGLWGVQARFACGATATWKTVKDRDPGNLIKRFLLRLRDGVEGACAQLCRYPFIVVGTANVRRFESETLLIKSLPQLNLTSNEIDEIKSVQCGQQGANVAVSFTTHDGRSGSVVCLTASKDRDHRLAAISLISA